MSTFHKIHPELQEFYKNFPKLELNEASLPMIRAGKLAAEIVVEDLPSGIARDRVVIDSAFDNAKISFLHYRPKDITEDLPVFFHIHGGGYIMGTANEVDIRNLDFAEKLRIHIISVEYRIAPEYPFPTPLNDCYSCLKYIYDNAANMHIDKNKIAIGGESAGGGLAAGLAQMVHDRNEVKICGQLLTYPMIDPFTHEKEYQNPNTGEFVWTREMNAFGWQAYMGDNDPYTPYLAPALRADLSGLAPCWINTNDMDLFLEENLTYATRLMQAGVPTEVNVYQGLPHAYQMAYATSPAQRFNQDYMTQIKRLVA